MTTPPKPPPLALQPQQQQQSSQNITSAIFQPVVQPAPSRPPLTGAKPSQSSTSKLPASCKPQEGPGRQLVWLITGATGLLGTNIVQAALSKGDFVIALSRGILDLRQKEIQNLQNVQSRGVQERTAATKIWSHERCLCVRCDVRLKGQVETAVKKGMEHFGKLDIVVNCAGWGILGACEEQTDHEVRSQFETNVYGTFNVIRQTLPILRNKEGAKFINLTSTTGIMGVPGLGPYCATKWAIEGLTESISQELEGFGCKATIVEIGNAQRSHDPASPKKWGHLTLKPPTIDDYIGTPVEHSKRMIIWLTDRQPTHPQKVGAMIWELGHCGSPPVRLVLGSHAVDTMRDKLRHSIEEIENWRGVSSLEQI